MLEVSLSCFGDIDGQIADAFEVGAASRRRDHEAKVDSDRLMQREQPETPVVDFNLKIVERLVSLDDIEEMRAVALDERVDGSLDPALCELRHERQSLPDHFKVTID
jgi:hypothetical protein